jgi:DNA-binding NarL/FixJ family response regulator
VLADARMPLLDGIGLARAVTGDADLRQTRVVLLSARHDRRLSEDASAAGALGCLDKNDSRREICDAVLSFARRPAPA